MAKALLMLPWESSIVFDRVRASSCYLTSSAELKYSEKCRKLLDWPQSISPLKATACPLPAVSNLQHMGMQVSALSLAKGATKCPLSCLLGVMDGHGGDGASSFVSNHLHHLVNKGCIHQYKLKHEDDISMLPMIPNSLGVPIS